MKHFSRFILIIALLGIPVAAGELWAAERTVYIATSGNGKRYHFENCRTLRNSGKRELAISEAKRLGYTACKVCHPGN